MFFKLLKDAFKVKQVRSKILFTIFIILVFRIGTTITVPGVNAKILNNLQDVSFLNMLSLVSGNAMRNFSVFALGVSPYITASIVVQLLQMDLLPKFVEWGKQGEVGRRKLNQATRYISLVLAFVQSIGITATFHTLSQAKLVATPNAKTYLLIGAILTTGSMIVTWLGEQITDKGYGNGVSMIIFAGIVSSIPEMIKEIYENAFVNVRSGQMTNSLIFVGVLILAVLVIVYFTTFVEQAQYKIPIQYTKIAQGAPSSSYLPLKVNPAGVIPVIFASSITAAPAAIFQVISAMGYNAGWVKTAQAMLATNTPTGVAMYALLIILFTFFYTFVQINPEKTAENLQKSGAYIPGVRPGKGTEEFMSRLLRRLASVGSVFLGFITIIPILARDLFGLTDAVALGGTSLLIIISTGIEGMKQLEGYLLKRKYVGFMDTTKGTQAAKIVEEFHVAHISTGDMFRAAMANQTEMGVLAKSYIDKGELVPDEVTNGIVKERLAQDDIKETGFLLDGYPRTIEQAHALDKTLAELGIELEGVINIEVNPDSLLERLSGRIIHRQTGETFHKVFNPPVDYKEEDYYQREDDKPETVKRRLDVNIAQGEPIIEFYRSKGLVHDIQGNQDINDVFSDIKKVLSNLK